MTQPSTTTSEGVAGGGTRGGGNEGLISATEASYYDSLMSPFYDTLSAFLWPQWVHPIVITILGGMFCASAIYAFGLVGNNDDGDDDSASKKWAWIGWTLYHMCDVMVGKHARRTQQTSTFGRVLDHTVDGLFGVYLGYCAMALVVFGLPTGSTLFNTGRHCFSLLWLAPHVVHQLEPKKSLVMETKLCSMEKGFLEVVGLLFYHAWIDANPLLARHNDAALLLANTTATAAIGYVIWSAMTIESTNGRKICWTAFYLLFAVIGYGVAQDPTTWWILWAPFVMATH